MPTTSFLVCINRVNLCASLRFACAVLSPNNLGCRMCCAVRKCCAVHKCCALHKCCVYKILCVHKCCVYTNAVSTQMLYVWAWLLPRLMQHSAPTSVASNMRSIVQAVCRSQGRLLPRLMQHSAPKSGASNMRSIVHAVCRFQGRLLPLLMQYSAPDIFSYPHCTVKVQKSKAGTSRVVVFREMGLTNRCGSEVEQPINAYVSASQVSHICLTCAANWWSYCTAYILSGEWDSMPASLTNSTAELQTIRNDMALPTSNAAR